MNSCSSIANTPTDPSNVMAFAGMVNIADDAC